MDNTKCYLCDSLEIQKKDGAVRNDDALALLECRRCGLVFLSSFDHLTENFYTESKQHDGEAEGLDTLSWVSQTETDDERRYQHLKQTLQNKRVLDFGCGTGNFLSKIKKEAQEVWGVESERRLIPYHVRQKQQVVCHLGDLPKDSKFDVITLFHVLEHLTDPVAVLRDLAERLLPDGQILIEIPNIDDALLTLYKNKAFSQFTYWRCHPFMYNVKSLKRLAQKSKLRVNTIDQLQRYPLSNHLFWLAVGKPGGHKEWAFLDSPELEVAYATKLKMLGKCDTIVARFSNL